MKKLFLLSLIAVLLTPTTAKAEPKFLKMWWWPSHWRDQNFTPYYDDKPTEPHNAQWGNSGWTPQEWTRIDPSKGYNLINGWRDAGILDDMKLVTHPDDDFVSVVEVGPNFYRLSGFDKRRVMETLNTVYQITSLRKPAMFYVRDAATDKVIGTYSKEGLTLE